MVCVESAAAHMVYLETAAVYLESAAHIVCVESAALMIYLESAAHMLSPSWCTACAQRRFLLLLACAAHVSAYLPNTVQLRLNSASGGAFDAGSPRQHAGAWDPALR
jgi:hypothetical protein